MGAPVAGLKARANAPARPFKVKRLAKPPKVRIGTRGSKLALAQAGQMQRLIAKALGASAREAAEVAPLVIITTSGDRIQDRRLLDIGGKGLFTKEIEEALLDGRIDCAVHSMKDVPTRRQNGLVIAATPEREDVRDAFVSATCASLTQLPRGARLGTASLRRQAQALYVRPDLVTAIVRGNVDTRLAKLKAGEADAMILALAGLNRLGLASEAAALLDPLEFPPAPGQGALAIETRVGDADTSWVRALDHAPTHICVAAERAALEALDGSCRTAIGAWGRIEEDELLLVVEALTPDGRQRFRAEGRTAPAPDEAAALGDALGLEVREAGGAALQLDG
jgi:hydroxymethylbilane synthase